MGASMQSNARNPAARPGGVQRAPLNGERFCFSPLPGRRAARPRSGVNLNPRATTPAGGWRAGQCRPRAAACGMAAAGGDGPGAPGVMLRPLYGCFTCRTPLFSSGDGFCSTSCRNTAPEEEAELVEQGREIVIQRAKRAVSTPPARERVSCSGAHALSVVYKLRCACRWGLPARRAARWTPRCAHRAHAHAHPVVVSAFSRHRRPTPSHATSNAGCARRWHRVGKLPRLRETL